MTKRIAAAVSVCFAALFFSLNICAEAKLSAGRATAVRCLKLAESSLASGDWDTALTQAQLGLSYDDKVADLWYISAAAQSGKGSVKADVLPLVTKALTEGEWVDYNRDGARILYADIMSDTGNWEQAVGVLDAAPFIYSADAEFIRIKSYYRMNTHESLEKARNKVNAARRIYPDDTRFPLLFFQYEWARRGETIDDAAKKIASAFIAKMPEYDNPDSELEVYAALFADGVQQKRLLQAFTAHGMKHPLFAGAALRAGIFTEQQAFDYFFSFADKETTLVMLEDFVKQITSDAVKQELAQHLTAFSGLLTVDTNGDLQQNLVVQYSRGRPQTLGWDKESDGVNEWSGTCDFGVPVTVTAANGSIQVFYGTYPAVIKAVYTGKDIKLGAVTFYLADETLDWTPFTMRVQQNFKDICGAEFFIPVVNTDAPELDGSTLVSSCSSYKMPTEERENASIRFTVLDSLPQTADYTADGKLYARAVFEKGFPVTRSVDNDGDGIFETTETFGYDPDNTMHRTAGDQQQVMTNLFGLPAEGSGLYVKMIQVDQNGDTVPDFTEEYTADNGKITSWDLDGDGTWDVRYERYPQANGKDVAEDAMFYMMPGRKLVTITSWNNVPVKVVSEGATYAVTEGAHANFYWFGKAGGMQNEEKVIESLNQTTDQGVSMIVEDEGKRMLAVRMADNMYAEILPPPESSGEETETKTEAQK